jgi:hypothetical protein
VNERLTSQILVSALMRQAQAAGGFAAVLHRGEAMSGAIVVQIVERGENIGLFERVTGLDGKTELVPVGPDNLSEFSALSDYIARRTRVDPDIWFLELDVADGQRLAAALLCAG